MEPSHGAAGRRWLLAAKIAFGLGLIGVLLYNVDLSALLAALRSVDLYYLAIMFLVPHLMIAFNTWKWQMFLRELALRPGFGRLFALYLVATFFNNFLPTMAGGDAVRGYALARDTRDASSVTAAIFMERMVGFAVLVALLPLALLVKVLTDAYPVVWLVVPATFAGFVACTVLAVTPRWDHLWRPLARVRYVGPVLQFIARTRAALFRAARSTGTLAASSLLSLLFYVGAAATVWAAVRSLGADASLLYLFMTVPLVLVLGMLPISLNGLGITEAGFAIILQLTGVPLVEAVAVGLLLRARLLVTSTIGGCVFLALRSDPALARRPSPGVD